MLAGLRQRLDIATPTARAGESERSFCRRFSAEIGEPPGRFVETLRIDAARTALEGGATAKAAAVAAGFASPEMISRVFKRRLDLSPMAYRRQHAAAQPRLQGLPGRQAGVECRPGPRPRRSATPRPGPGRGPQGPEWGFESRLKRMRPAHRFRVPDRVPPPASGCSSRADACGLGRVVCWPSRSTLKVP